MSKILYTSDGKIINISNQDHHYFSRFKWHIHKDKGKMYPYRRVGKKKIYMQNEMYPHGRGYDIDHINRNTLDNRRTNMRLVTRFHNCSNSGPKQIATKTSRFKGVYLDKNSNRYRIEICNGYKIRQLSGIMVERIAALIYDLASIDRLGEYSCPNLTKKEAIDIIRNVYDNKAGYGDPEKWVIDMAEKKKSKNRRISLFTTNKRFYR